MTMANDNWVVESGIQLATWAGRRDVAWSAARIMT